MPDPIVHELVGEAAVLITAIRTTRPDPALSELKVRVVNVVDLMRLQPESEHPHVLPDAECDAIFTTDRPILLAYHGYPRLIHRLTYRRHGHHNLHVRGLGRNA